MKSKFLFLIYVFGIGFVLYFYLNRSYIWSEIPNIIYSNSNISGNLLCWFKTYLLDRRQRVTVLGATSSEKLVLSGVPQRSILGPILFLLYVNDLPDAVKNCKVSSFADDTKVFNSFTSRPSYHNTQKSYPLCGSYLRFNACYEHKNTTTRFSELKSPSS
jgi:hypothetical protein